MTNNLKSGKLSIFPLFIWISFGITILAGAAGVILPSLDFFPAAGQTRLSFDPWITLFKSPGLVQSILVTLFTGLAATFCSLCLTLLFVSLFYRSPVWQWFEKLLAPILSIPHAAFAIGFSFLIAPSGWIMRLLSPHVTAFEVPPDWVLVNDPFGITLTLAMIMKEFPFLIMVTLSAASRLRIEPTLHVGQSMGYQKEQVWFKVLVPRLYPHLRLSVYAIIAYSLSVVDMALILGPSSPPTFAVYILKWFNDPSISYKLVAAAGSTLLFAMVAGTIFMVHMIEKLAGYAARRWIVNGTRRSPLSRIKFPLSGAIITLIACTGLSTLILVVWSFTLKWRFPEALPTAWSAKFWYRGVADMQDPLVMTLLTGACATLISMVMVIGCLEHDALQKQIRRMDSVFYTFIYIPVLIPQISFMAGVQLLLVIFNLDGMWISLVWSHILYILPYLFITLKATYLDFDPRVYNQAALLGKSRYRAFFGVKLPMLLRPILFSAAIGFSVSVAQYIPTMLVGSGRFFTITTEVVSLAAGSDRRAVAVYALIQQCLPMVIYGLAILLPKAIYYNKKGMH